MTHILLECVTHPARAVAYLAIALLSVECPARACDTPLNLHIEVSSNFDTLPVRSDYTLADIAALARQQNHKIDHELLGFYTSEFGYTIDLIPQGDRDCPARVDGIVTLRLQHRLIELAQEVASNSCLYPIALQHYHRLAAADEQTVERFSALAADTLSAGSLAFKKIHPPHADDLNTTLREKIRVAVDGAVASLHGARRDAQQAINNSNELRSLARSCST